jgi:hypothetical protein
MAIQPPPAGMDRTELAEILQGFQKVLGEGVYEHEEWFVEEMRVHLQSAWSTFASRIATATEYLNSPPDPQLLDAQLASVGMTGAESIPKREGLGGSIARWFLAPSKRAFQSVLGWANIILGSLSGIVPGIEAAKEYKEVCEQAIEDAELIAGEGGEPESPPSGPPKRPRKNFKL